MSGPLQPLPLAVPASAALPGSQPAVAVHQDDKAENVNRLRDDVKATSLAIKEALDPFLPPVLTDIVDQYSRDFAKSVSIARGILQERMAKLQDKADALGIDPDKDISDFKPGSEEHAVLDDISSTELCIDVLDDMRAGKSAADIAYAHDIEDARKHASRIPGVSEVFKHFFTSIDPVEAASQALQVLQRERPLGRLDGKGDPSVEILTESDESHIEKVQRGNYEGCILIDGLYLDLLTFCRAAARPASARHLLAVAREMRRRNVVVPRPGGAPLTPLAPILIESLCRWGENHRKLRADHVAKDSGFLALAGKARDALRRQDAPDFRRIAELIDHHEEVLTESARPLLAMALGPLQLAVFIMEASARRAAASDGKGVEQAPAPAARQPEGASAEGASAHKRERERADEA